MRRFNETYKKRQFITRNDWADTYKSIHAQTEESVILKVISNKSENEEYINNLSKEVEELKQIKHPNLTSVHGMFKYDGIGQAHYYYIEGEYFKGITLKEKLNEGKFEKNEAIKIVEQLAKALEKFHNKSKSFEALNIENILINPKGPRNPKDLIKIDILSYLENKKFEVNLQENLDDLEKNQCDKNLDENKFTPEKDIYSLGVVLYCLLSGKTNFEKSKYEKDINDENILKIIQNATDKELPKAYPSLKIFTEDLKSYLEDGQLKSETYDYDEANLDNNKCKKGKSKKNKSKKILGICALLIILGTVSIKGIDLLEQSNNDKSVDKIKQESTDNKKEEKDDKDKVEKEEKVDESENDKPATSNNTSKPSSNNTNSNTTNSSQNSSPDNNGNSSNNNNVEKPSNPEGDQNSSSTPPKPDPGNNGGEVGNPEVQPPDNSTSGGNTGNEGATPETPEVEVQE